MESCQNAEESKNRELNRELNESSVLTNTYTRGSPDSSRRYVDRGRRDVVHDERVLATEHLITADFVVTEQREVNEPSAALSEPLLGACSGDASTRNLEELKQPTDHDLRDIEAMLSQARQLKEQEETYQSYSHTDPMQKPSTIQEAETYLERDTEDLNENSMLRGIPFIGQEALFAQQPRGSGKRNPMRAKQRQGSGGLSAARAQ